MGVIEGIVDLLDLLLTIFLGYIKSFWSIIVPPARKSIKGQIVLVTGAGGGIGRELALELSRREAVLVLWDVNMENNNKTASLVNETGGKAYTYACDITNSSEVYRVADQVRNDVGEVSILVNNAGILNGGPLLELSEKDIRRTFEVNTLAHFWTVKAFLPSMLKRKVGHICNIVSMAALGGTEMLTDYCASKAGALFFGNALDTELRKSGNSFIKITAVCPMFVDTGLVKKFDYKKGRVLTPKEVAYKIVEGIQRNYELVCIPGNLEYMNRLAQLFPRASAKRIADKLGVTVYDQYSNKKD